MGLDYCGRESWLTQDRMQAQREQNEYRWKLETLILQLPALSVDECQYSNYTYTY